MSVKIYFIINYKNSFIKKQGNAAKANAGTAMLLFFCREATSYPGIPFPLIKGKRDYWQ
jgi:hypothetical protein